MKFTPTVHPRVCGEHTSSVLSFIIPTGSSPRLRGTRRPPGLLSLSRRFIPASAGNTKRDHHHLVIHAVHPRVCGEHLTNHNVSAITDGSSPRLRGTLNGGISCILLLRFIPASAGNTQPSTPTGAGSTVHPRVCGEHPLLRYCTNPLSGSSPRLRGTQSATMAAPLHMRFIPASAGNTPYRRSAFWSSTVHPRVCGEHSPSWCSCRMATGSSPRLRGTHVTCISPSGDIRFIPASAGNTPFTQAPGSFLSVHPRVCGEHFSGGQVNNRVAGSSPRLRGTPRKYLFQIRM